MVTTSQIRKLLTEESNHFEQLDMLEEAHIFQKYSDKLDEIEISASNEPAPPQKQRDAPLYGEALVLHSHAFLFVMLLFQIISLAVQLIQLAE